MQVIISCLLIGLEVGISATMLVLEPARATHLYPSRDRAVLTCNTSARGVLAPLAFDFVLIALCTLYAVKTRNVPENFNEAKFIGFAMYTTCVIWVAFVPIYFGSESKVSLREGIRKGGIGKSWERFSKGGEGWTGKGNRRKG